MQTWEAIAGNGGIYEVTDFEVAAYRLLTEQILYHADKSSRTAYAIVQTYEREFRELLRPFGVDVGVNHQLRYAYAIPRHEKGATATVGQTLMALVLRGVYDEALQKGEELTDDGELLVDFVELGQKYELMVGKELPAKGEFDANLRVLARWGIVRKVDIGDVQGADGAIAERSGIAIRPGIVMVLGESAIARLTLWTRREDVSGQLAIAELEAPENQEEEAES